MTGGSLRPAAVLLRLAADVAVSRTALWFAKHEQQDKQAGELFGAQVERALAGQLQAWQDEPQGWLATLLLLDQLPRMIYRDTPRAFAGYLDYAERHQRVIPRFGRFPHRNQILGRNNSAEESAFLLEPGSRF